MGKFRNLYPPKLFFAKGLIEIIPWLYQRIRLAPLKISDFKDEHILPKKEISSGFNKALKSRDDFITWLGHCSFLIRLDGQLLLTDPFLEGTAGPAFIKGLKRLEVPLDIKKIKPDLILISHSHLDHMHLPSLRKLKNKSATVIIPLNLEHRVTKAGYNNIKELNWFENTKYKNLKITALPSHHYSEFFTRKSLWASFKIESKSKSIFFSGDTGYSAIFKDYVAEYGPFDLGLIGIGGYFLKNKKTSQVSKVHTNPQGAMQIAKDIGCRQVVGMHWGTVRLSDETQNELPKLLTKASKYFDIPAKTLRIGETIRI